MVLLLIVGCRITGSGLNNNDDAFLLVQNLTSFNVYLTVDDGSLGPYEERLLLPGDELLFSWDDHDEIFTVNNGIAFLTYRDDQGDEESSQVAIFNGQTITFTISENATILVVDNETNADIWFNVNNGDLINLQSMENDVISFGELNYLIDVSLYYTGYHVFSNTTSIDLFPFSTEYFDIEADAGAVEVRNYGLPDITEVYIAPSESAYWGQDVLSSILETGESGYWTVEPGWWDIKTVDQYGDSEEFYDNYIGLDSTEFIGVRGLSEIREITKSENKSIHYSVEFKTINHQKN